ncbi:MAG: hypothetical protein HXY40_02510 [Chloroflexi bacterium]|nr:hypothetical protein [Chloroflexota bacterium]
MAGLSVRWAGQYAQAVLYVDLPPGAYAMSFSAQAFARARMVRVAVNDMLIGSVTVEAERFDVFTLAVPAEVIGDGRHITLTLAYDNTDTPAETGAGDDPRPLAIMVDWVQWRLSQ